MHDTPDVCRADGECRDYHHPAGHAAWTSGAPLCAECLRIAERDIRNLLYDWIDLAQLHEPSLSQALNERTSGSAEAPIPLRMAVDELQAEILHAATLWEQELRDAQRLADPPNHVRPGAAVQRAINTITPRLHALARLPERDVFPTGCEDEPAPMAGWQAVLHLASLHGRARGMLGRTRRTLHLPGNCWRDECGAAELRRQEPERAGDDPDVWCATCDHSRPHPHYETYTLTLVWPDDTQVTA